MPAFDCVCMHLSAVPTIRTHMCGCVCESKRSSFVVRWWTGCLRLTGLHLHWLHCKSVCVVKAGQQGGGAPCLSVRHCCCVLQHLVGQFCFNKQQKWQEEKGLQGVVGHYLVSLICSLKYTSTGFCEVLWRVRKMYEKMTVCSFSACSCSIFT